MSTLVYFTYGHLFNICLRLSCIPSEYGGILGLITWLDGISLFKEDISLYSINTTALDIEIASVLVSRLYGG